MMAKSSKSKLECVTTPEWSIIRNKLDTLLRSTNILTTDQIIVACRAIDSMPHEERIQHITNTWGKLYTDRSMPLLLQLRNIEIASGVGPTPQQQERDHE